MFLINTRLFRLTLILNLIAALFLLGAFCGGETSEPSNEIAVIETTISPTSVFEPAGEAPDDPGPPGPIYLKVWAENLTEGNFDQLIEDTTRVLGQPDLKEFHSQARIFRAVAELSKDDANIAQAEADLRQVANVDPDLQMNKELFLLGQIAVLEKTGNIEQAESIRENAQQEFPDADVFKKLQLGRQYFEPRKLFNEQLQHQQLVEPRISQ